MRPPLRATLSVSRNRPELPGSRRGSCSSPARGRNCSPRSLTIVPTPLWHDPCYPRRRIIVRLTPRKGFPMRTKLAVAALALLGATAPALAAGFADPAAIDRAVAAFTGAPIGTPGGARTPVDRRLRLAACNAGLM